AGRLLIRDLHVLPFREPTHRPGRPWYLAHPDHYRRVRRSGCRRQTPGPGLFAVPGRHVALLGFCALCAGDGGAASAPAAGIAVAGAGPSGPAWRDADGRYLVLRAGAADRAARRIAGHLHGLSIAGDPVRHTLAGRESRTVPPGGGRRRLFGSTLYRAAGRRPP